MRAVLDVNVIVSALLAPSGTPARVVRAWLEGAFELVVSPSLLEELERALGYRKLHRRIDRNEVAQVIAWLNRFASTVPDPELPPPVRSADPGDDYLIAIAVAERAALVSGDQDLLALAGELPIFTPAGFLELLEA